MENYDTIIPRKGTENFTAERQKGKGKNEEKEKA